MAGDKHCSNCGQGFGGRDSVPLDLVNEPPHYKTESGLEAIDVIEAFKLNYHLGNVTKYILRAGKKDDTLQDLKKARWYLEREIKMLGGRFLTTEETKK
jgi:hypothetical protein